jgi:hypothetical protein
MECENINKNDLIMGFYRGPHIVTDGLVLSLDAGNVKSYPGSGTTWFDKSGFGNNGTLTNGPTFNSGNGGSIVFDGTNDYVQTATNSIPNNSSFSLACYFNITTLNSAFRPLVDGGNLGSGTAGYTLAIDNTNRLFIAVNAGYISINTSLSTNTWYYIVGTALAGSPYTLSIYVNGILATPFASANTNTLTNNALYNRLGTSITGTPIRFPGRIASTQIYNRALTAQEVLQNYNATKSRYNL